MPHDWSDMAPCTLSPDFLERNRYLFPHISPFSFLSGSRYTRYICALSFVEPPLRHPPSIHFLPLLLYSPQLSIAPPSHCNCQSQTRRRGLESSCCRLIIVLPAPLSLSADTAKMTPPTPFSLSLFFYSLGRRG